MFTWKKPSFSYSEFQTLLSRLQKNDPTLTELTFVNIDHLVYSEENIMALLNAIGRNHTLRSISLSFSGGRDNKEYDGKSYYAGESYGYKLFTLIDYKVILKVLIQVLSVNKQLHTIKFEYGIDSGSKRPSFSEIDVGQSVLALINDHPMLRVLHVYTANNASNKISEKEKVPFIKSLSTILIHNQKLEELDISGGGLQLNTKKDSEQLAHALTINNTLKILKIYLNVSNYEMWNTLLASFRFNKSIHSFVSNMPTGKEDNYLLADILKINTTLRTLNLGNGNGSLDLEQCAALAEALETNQTLIKLDGIGFCCSSIVKSSIYAALERNKNVTISQSSNVINLFSSMNGQQPTKSESALSKSSIPSFKSSFLPSTSTNDNASTKQELMLDKDIRVTETKSELLEKPSLIYPLSSDMPKKLFIADNEEPIPIDLYCPNKNLASDQTLSLVELSRVLMVFRPWNYRDTYYPQILGKWARCTQKDIKLQRSLFELIEASKTVIPQKLVFEYPSKSWNKEYIDYTWNIDEFNFHHSVDDLLQIRFRFNAKYVFDIQRMMQVVCEGFKAYAYFLKLLDKFNDQGYDLLYDLRLCQMLGYVDDMKRCSGPELSERLSDNVKQWAVIIFAFVDTKFKYNRDQSQKFQFRITEYDFELNFKKENKLLYDQACSYYKEEMIREKKDESSLMLPEIDQAKVATNAVIVLNSARISFKKKNFRNAYILHAGLAYADFQYSDCTGINLYRADMRHSNFTGANLSDSYLKYADLRSANFSRAKLYNCDFSWLEESEYQYHCMDLNIKAKDYCKDLNIDGAEGLSAESISLLKKHGAVGTPKSYSLSTQQAEQEQKWQEAYSIDTKEKVNKKKPLKSNSSNQDEVGTSTHMFRRASFSGEEVKSSSIQDLSINQNKVPKSSAPLNELSDPVATQGQSSFLANTTQSMYFPTTHSHIDSEITPYVPPVFSAPLMEYEGNHLASANLETKQGLDKKGLNTDEQSRNQSLFMHPVELKNSCSVVNHSNFFPKLPEISVAPVHVKVPEHFYCPITQTMMGDPVITLFGKTYERKEIAEWLENHDTDPLTNEHLPSKVLIPNDLVRGMILEWKEQNPDHPEVIAANHKKKEF